jgi:hypothetical protein
MSGFVWLRTLLVTFRSASVKFLWHWFMPYSGLRSQAGVAGEEEAPGIQLDPRDGKGPLDVRQDDVALVQRLSEGRQDLDGDRADLDGELVGHGVLAQQFPRGVDERLSAVGHAEVLAIPPPAAGDGAVVVLPDDGPHHGLKIT